MTPVNTSVFHICDMELEFRDRWTDVTDIC